MILKFSFTRILAGVVSRLWRQLRQEFKYRGENNKKKERKKSTTRPRAVHDRANMYCVTSYSLPQQDYALSISCAASYSELFLHTLFTPIRFCLHPRFIVQISHKPSFRASKTPPSQPLLPSQRKFPVDLMWLVGPRADAVTFTCCHIEDETSWFLTKVPLSVISNDSELNESRTLVFLSFRTLFQTPLSFYSYLSIQHSSGYELQSGILYAIYAIVPLWTSNNIKYLRVYLKLVSLPCRGSVKPSPAAVTHTPAQAGRSVHLVAGSAPSSLLSTPEHTFDTLYPITIFHSATRKPRPWHSPAPWLAERPQSLSSSPESHVADACLQTSQKSHGNRQAPFYRKPHPSDANLDVVLRLNYVIFLSVFVGIKTKTVSYLPSIVKLIKLI